MAMMDPYEVLGIGRQATDEEVKRAYRDKAKQYHPDKFADNPLADLAEEKFKEIQNAYDTIMKERESGGSYYQSSSQRSGSTQQNARYGSELQTVREMINRNDIFNARITLSRATNRPAEWYYLSGIVELRMGSYNTGISNLQRAVSMDPNNMEYRTTWNQVMAQSQSYQGNYRQYGGNNDACDLCCKLWCADTLCECMGGDLCSCM